MRFLFFFVLLLTALSLLAQPLTDSERTTIDNLVMADIPDGGPGAAVGVVRNGHLIYERYAGLADVANLRPITAATRFNLASNAKQFTSVRALKLIDEGKLALQDDIRTFFPDLYPNLEAPITIQQLINHTSGLRDVYALWGILGYTWWKNDFSNADAIALLHQQEDLNFPSGTRHLYSNTNYILLAEIIAKVTGTSFKEDMDTFFAQLGMPTTSFRDQTKVPVPDLARPYFNFDTWKTYELPATTHGDGALFGNLRDQLTWETSLQTGQSPVLTPAQLTRSQLPLDTVTDYAYGLENAEYRRTPISYHDGSTGAWKASTLRFPGKGLAIVVLNNSGKFGTNYLARQIADALLFSTVEAKQHPLGPDTLGPNLRPVDILGTYLLNGSYFYRFVERDGALLLERPNRGPVAIEWEKGNVFREIKDPAFRQAFTRNEDGALTVTAYYPREKPYTLTKIDQNWEEYDLSQVSGQYYNSELDLTVEITAEGDRDFKVKVGKNKRTLTMELIDQLTFRGSPLRFRRNQQNIISGLIYDNDRVQNLSFIKLK